MLFIALTEWTSKVNNTGKSHVLTIKEKSLVTQCMVAVIPDIQTQEDSDALGRNSGSKLFQTEELGTDRRCDCQIALGKECSQCKLYKERNHTEGHVLIVIVTKTYFFLKSTL